MLFSLDLFVFFFLLLPSFFFNLCLSLPFFLKNINKKSRNAINF